MPMISFLARLTRLAAVAIAAFALSGIEAPPAGAEELAKTLFGAKRLPAAMPAQSFGFYSKGCFSGGVAIPTDGPTWQAMRLSRNRRWGHPTMIAAIEKLSRDGAAKDGWPGLLIGDISQPRGGPMLTGHASHQLGLDADIWFTPMPSRTLSKSERENMTAVSMIKGLYVNDKVWTPAHARILKRAASYPEVERILVNPGIKKKLCETTTGDRGWLQKVRPFWGHDYHFHIRIGCQPGSPGCKPQADTTPGDGCDAKTLDWWFTKAAKLPDDNADTPKARDKMTMKSLPKACALVLDAPSPPSEMAATFRGKSQGTGDGAGSGGQSIAALLGAEPEAAAGLPPEASAFLPTPDSGVPLPQPRPKK